jgi:hypothetical protein
MNDLKIHSGACFCGAVQLKVSGAPALPLHVGRPKWLRHHARGVTFDT